MPPSPARLHQPGFNYIAQDCRDRALAQAAAPLAEGPLSGVPFLVKDLGINIRGVRTGSGSRYFSHVPETQSIFVDRADAAGLLTFGKTTTPELGLTVTTESTAHGLTRNPWNSEKTTGGSSAARPAPSPSVLSRWPRPPMAAARSACPRAAAACSA
jgi:amidase